MKSITASRVMERLQIDLIDKSSDSLRWNPKEYKYILTILDVFSRYTWLFPLTGKTSHLVASALDNLFMSYGIPDIVQNDQGKEFCGEVTSLLKAKKIRHIRSSPYYPQAQGKIERSHRLLKDVMNYDAVHKKSVNWVADLKCYAQVVNDRPRQNLGMSTPFEVYFGRKRRGMSLMTADQIHKVAHEATVSCNAQVLRQQEKYLKTPTYNVGDKVFLRLRSQKESRVSGRRFYATGKIVQRNLRLYKYKVLYKSKNIKGDGWFHVKDIIGHTKKMQTELEANSSPFLKPISHSDRVNNLQEDNNIRVSFDPVGDGNCLFRAVAFLLNGNDSNHNKLRANVVSYLLSHPCLGNQSAITWHASLNDESPIGYINRMGMDGTYADQIAIQGLSEMLSMQILIISSLNGGTTLIRPNGNSTFDPNKPYVVVGHLAENQGDHYLAVDDNTDQSIPLVVRASQVSLVSDENPEIHDNAIAIAHQEYLANGHTDNNANEEPLLVETGNSLQQSVLSPHQERQQMAQESEITRSDSTSFVQVKSIVNVTDDEKVRAGPHQSPETHHDASTIAHQRYLTNGHTENNAYEEPLTIEPGNTLQQYVLSPQQERQKMTKESEISRSDSTSFVQVKSMVNVTDDAKAHAGPHQSPEIHDDASTIAHQGYFANGHIDNNENEETLIVEPGNTLQQSVLSVQQEQQQMTQESEITHPNSMSPIQVTSVATTDDEKVRAGPQLPEEIVADILSRALVNQLVKYYVMRRDPFFSRLISFVRKPNPKCIYLHECNEKMINPKMQPQLTVSINKLSSVAGKSSGLMLEIKKLFQGLNKWYTAWLVLVKQLFGWYRIDDVYWK